MNARRISLPPLDTPKLCKSEISVLTLAYQGLDDRGIEKALALKPHLAAQLIKTARIKHKDYVQMQQFKDLFKGRPQASLGRGLRG